MYRGLSRARGPRSRCSLRQQAANRLYPSSAGARSGGKTNHSTQDIFGMGINRETLWNKHCSFRCLVYVDVNNTVTVFAAGDTFWYGWLLFIHFIGACVFPPSLHRLIPHAAGFPFCHFSLSRKLLPIFNFLLSTSFPFTVCHFLPLLLNRHHRQPQSHKVLHFTVAGLGPWRHLSSSGHAL